MFCNKCGHKLSDTANFCAGCGSRITRNREYIPVSSSSTQFQEDLSQKTTFGTFSSESQKNATTNKDDSSRDGLEFKKNTKVETVSVTCPRCGGEVKTVDGLDTFYCLYCGNRVVLSGMSDASYEAKTKARKYEKEERMQANAFSHEKEMYIMQKEEEKKSTKRFLIISALVVLFILGVIIWIAYPSIKVRHSRSQLVKLNEKFEDLLDEEDYDEAEKVNKQIKKLAGDLKGDEWGEWIGVYLENYYQVTKAQRKEKSIKHKKVKLKADLEDIDDMKKEDVVEYLLKVGFVNITYVIEDADTLFSTKWGSVDEITIDGNDDCEAGEYFYDDVEVIVRVWTS